MTQYLLLVTLGPVQDFIAQARRTRDLWYGSHLLSEISRAAARALAHEGAILIFPALDVDHPELEPCDQPLRPSSESPPQNIANKLLCIVPADRDPRRLAQEARRAATQFLAESVAERVRRDCRDLLGDGVDDVWREQIESLIEFNAAWEPLGGYKEARSQVERAVAGRKFLRDFQPWTRSRLGAPKSSLDGGRESVLRRRRPVDLAAIPKDEASRVREIARQYRIADEEELDAVGLVKRAGGSPGQFVPIVNVALGPWIEVVQQGAGSELATIAQDCARIGASRVNRPKLPCASRFHFDASLLLESRAARVLEELGAAGEAKDWEQRLRAIYAKVGAPHPYVACLVADGDHMGRAIDAIDSLEEHRALSRAMAAFASEARQVVEMGHDGSVVYAGGDDVLAFLPVVEAVKCAQALRSAFDARMASAGGSLPGEMRPTLSVGVGIGHVMESMTELLDLGRSAEREAKQRRNSLAIVVAKRSGTVRTWSAPWVVPSERAHPKGPAERLVADAELLRDRLPTRKIYEIKAMLRHLPNRVEADDAIWSRLLEREVRRTLGRIEGKPLSPEDTGLDLDTTVGYRQLRRCVVSWVDRLLVARALADAVPGLRSENVQAVEG